MFEHSLTHLIIEVVFKKNLSINFKVIPYILFDFKIKNN